MGTIQSEQTATKIVPWVTKRSNKSRFGEKKPKINRKINNIKLYNKAKERAYERTAIISEKSKRRI